MDAAFSTRNVRTITIVVIYLKKDRYFWVIMSHASPKFSIIIPAYNRAEYLRYTLDTCISQSYQSVEFIVQDDASTDDTRDVVERYREIDGRIIYQNIGQNSGMKGNFERALENASGQYIICLGADDALIPDTLHDLAAVTDRHPSMVISWPTSTYHYDQARGGRGQIIAPHEMFGRNIEVELSSNDYFHRQVTKLFYADDQKAPMLYVKSCVPKLLINKIKKQSGGVFFSSSTPDGYSGFAIASVCSKYIYTNTSYTMHGVSPSSAGLNYVSGSNDKNDHSKKFFKDSQSVPMAHQLASQPYSPLITLMTADFIFQTDNIFKHNHSKKISLEKVLDKSLSELCDGLFAEERISRELLILNNISKYTGHHEIYIEMINSKKRNIRSILKGDAISFGLIYIDCRSRNINNVFEAAKYIKRYRNSIKVYAVLNWIKAIYNAILYKRKSYALRESLVHYHQAA